jgi:hypothetical protein
MFEKIGSDIDKAIASIDAGDWLTVGQCAMILTQDAVSLWQNGVLAKANLTPALAMDVTPLAEKLTTLATATAGIDTNPLTGHLILSIIIKAAIQALLSALGL